MTGIFSLVRAIILVAIGLGIAGTLLEATGWVGHEAIRAHQKGGISFQWLNRQLSDSAAQSRTPPSVEEGK